MAAPGRNDLEAFTLALPERFEAFDIINVAPKIWPHVYVMAIEPGPRFRLSVTGSHIDQHVHRNCTGLYMDEIVHGPRSRDVLRFFHSTITAGRALKVTHRVALPGRPELSIFATARPYMAVDNRPSNIIGSILFTVRKATDLHNITFEIQDLGRNFDNAA